MKSWNTLDEKTLDSYKEEIETARTKNPETQCEKVGEYYRYLADNKHEYGNLAYLAATNKGIEGRYANNYLASVARKSGIEVTENLRQKMMCDLALADIKERAKAHGEVIPGKTIQEYHHKVLKDNNLPARAWTGNIFEDIGPGAFMFNQGSLDQHGGNFTAENINAYITKGTVTGSKEHRDIAYFTGEAADGVLAKTVRESSLPEIVTFSQKMRNGLQGNVSGLINTNNLKAALQFRTRINYKNFFQAEARESKEPTSLRPNHQEAQKNLQAMIEDPKAVIIGEVYYYQLWGCFSYLETKAATEGKIYNKIFPDINPLKEAEIEYQRIYQKPMSDDLKQRVFFPLTLSLPQSNPTPNKAELIDSPSLARNKAYNKDASTSSKTHIQTRKDSSLSLEQREKLIEAVNASKAPSIPEGVRLDIRDLGNSEHVKPYQITTKNDNNITSTQGKSPLENTHAEFTKPSNSTWDTIYSIAEFMESLSIDGPAFGEEYFKTENNNNTATQETIQKQNINTEATASSTSPSDSVSAVECAKSADLNIFGLHQGGISTQTTQNDSDIISTQEIIPEQTISAVAAHSACGAVSALECAMSAELSSFGLYQTSATPQETQNDVGEKSNTTDSLDTQNDSVSFVEESRNDGTATPTPETGSTHDTYDTTETSTASGGFFSSIFSFFGGNTYESTADGYDTTYTPQAVSRTHSRCGTPTNYTSFSSASFFSSSGYESSSFAEASASNESSADCSATDSAPSGGGIIATLGAMGEAAMMSI